MDPEAQARKHIDELLIAGLTIQEQKDANRFCAFPYDDLLQRDKVSLDIF